MQVRMSGAQWESLGNFSLRDCVAHACHLQLSFSGVQASRKASKRAEKGTAKALEAKAAEERAAEQEAARAAEKEARAAEEATQAAAEASRREEEDRQLKELKVGTICDDCDRC